MDRFVEHTGIVAPMDRVNVDTDQICPAQFLKRIEKTGFGPTLFHSWRFLSDGQPNPEFELNDPRYLTASILVTGKNFGCGSSREHAVWALMDYGFRVVIGSSFADIFHKNCLEGGLVPVLLDQQTVDTMTMKARQVAGYSIKVNLESCLVTDSDGLNLTFRIHGDDSIHDFRRHCILNGLDDIGLTLQHEDKITAYERVAKPHGD